MTESISLDDKYPEKFEAMKKLYQQYAQEHNIVEIADDWNPWEAAAH